MRLIEFLNIIAEDTGPSVTINYKGKPKRAVKPVRARSDVLVTVHTATFDKAFKRSGEGWYTGPGGTGATIGDRYPRFEKWIEQNDTFEVPEVYVDDRGIVSFTNGRHRYSVFRDAGVDPMPVAMDRTEGLPNAKKHGLIASINEGTTVQEEEEIERAPAVYKDLIKHVEDGDLATLIEKLTHMSKFDVSIFLSHVRKYLGSHVMAEIIQYWKTSLGMSDSLNEAVLAEQTKCGVANALMKYRPDLKDEFDKVPSGKVNPSILFLQDYGMWNDRAQQMALQMKSAMQTMQTSKTEMEYAKSEGEKAELENWYKANKEAYLKKRSELMCYVVHLVKDSRDLDKQLAPFRTDKPE
jgi:hypothetical protein